MLNKISYLQEKRPDRVPRQVSDRLGKTWNPMLAIFSLSFWKTWHILSWIYLNFLRSEKLWTTKFWWLKDFVIISTVMSIFRNKNDNSRGGKTWQKDFKNQWESHRWQVRYDLSILSPVIKQIQPGCRRSSICIPNSLLSANYRTTFSISFPRFWFSRC